MKEGAAEEKVVATRGPEGGSKYRAIIFPAVARISKRQREPHRATYNSGGRG